MAFPARGGNTSVWEQFCSRRGHKTPELRGVGVVLVLSLLYGIS